MRTRRKEQKTKQVLIWSGDVVPSKNPDGVVFPKIPFDQGEIKKLYTLFNESDVNKKPSLPIVPVHLENCFIEDKVHDWQQDIDAKNIHYYSRITGQGVWLLLEVIC